MAYLDRVAAANVGLFFVVNSYLPPSISTSARERAVSAGSYYGGVIPEHEQGYFVIDSGAVFLNYGETDELLIGATRGGNVFSIETDYTDMGYDGAFGTVKGAKFVSRVKAVLTVNLIEFTSDTLRRAFPGSTRTLYGSQYSIARAADVLFSDYHTNVTLVGEVWKSNRPVICTVYNALIDGPVEIGMAEGNEATIKLRFTGHYLIDNMEEDPWMVSWPIVS
jgi:hypothetical protein